MILLNFSHPLTAEHLTQVESMAGEPIERVIEGAVQIAEVAKQGALPDHRRGDVLMIVTEGQPRDSFRLFAHTKCFAVLAAAAERFGQRELPRADDAEFALHVLVGNDALAGRLGQPLHHGPDVRALEAELDQVVLGPGGRRLRRRLSPPHD